ncbi:hypothetical protein AB4254_07940 [Vibrio breoganii]
MNKLKSYPAIERIWNEGGDEFEIYYSKPSFFNDAIMGHDFVCKVHEHLTNDINKHIEYNYLKIGDIKAKLEPAAIFDLLQKAHWNPKGEANSLLANLGITRSSMTVGDIIKHKTSNQLYIVEPFGFKLVHLK